MRTSNAKDTLDCLRFSRRYMLGFGVAGVTLNLAGCGGGADSEVPVADPTNPNGDASGSEGGSSGVTYAARWTHTLIPEIGHMPTWRTGDESSLPTVRDCWGYLRSAKRGEARFWGARRVQNLIRGSADLGNASYWFSVGSLSAQLMGRDSTVGDSTGAFRAYRISKATAQSARVQSVGVLSGVRHTLSLYARAETTSEIYLQLYVSGGAISASGTFTVSAEGWTRVQISGLADGVSSYRILLCPGAYNNGAPGSIFVCNVQLEDVSGHENDAASEYIPTDLPSPAPWFNGAMVDGVKYFDTYKGNTVLPSGVVVEQAGPQIAAGLLQGLRLEPSAVNLCLQSESFANWTVNAGSMTVQSSVAGSPRLDKTATRLIESTTFVSKFLSQDLGPMVQGTALTVSVFAKAETGRWLRLNVTLSDGSTAFGFFDLANGVLGNVVRAGQTACWAHIERWGGQWYRCVLTTTNTAGASNPVMRLGISSSNGVTAYTGVGASILVWGAHASPTEFIPSYIQNSTATGPVSRQSQSLDLSNAGNSVMGRQNYVIAIDSFPAYFTGVTNKGGTRPAWRPIWYAYATGYYAPQNRLGLGFRPTTAAVFGDRYLGDPNLLYFWRPNTFYAAGSIVIPTDTEVDNANSRRMFTCMVAGVSGATEPQWNSTFVSPPDLTSSLTFDGAARWQCNHDNTIVGIWEPYDTSILEAAYSVFGGVAVSRTGQVSLIPAVERVRASYYSVAGAYGFAINGQSATLRTAPFPIDGSTAGDLHRDIESIRFGRLSETATSHPIGISNLRISSEVISASENASRTVNVGG